MNINDEPRILEISFDYSEKMGSDTVKRAVVLPII
jgi:hypothetical protein